jgi:membrane protein DedA with SNARE-associated domain
MLRSGRQGRRKASGRHGEEIPRVHDVDYLLQHFEVGDLDYSWFAKFISLVVLPFADEDFAIILGGYIVVNKLMPVTLVVAAIFAGMVASDFTFYGIGAAARRLPWLSRYAVDDRVEKFADTLKRNVFEVVAFCRVVPGIDLIGFVACGWTRVPLARFLLASIAVSALYLPLMLYLVVMFGDALDDHVGLWTWPFLLASVVLIGFVRNRIFSLRETLPKHEGGASERPARHRLRFAEVRRRAPVGRTMLARFEAGPRALRWFKLR